MRKILFTLIYIALYVIGVDPTYAASRPHIVIFLADDLGWGDVGYHRSEIKTPNIDQLAAQGVRAEQFYVQPMCTPTRAALLTGRYPFRYGLQNSVIKHHDKYGLPLNERTLAQALKESGYYTALLGKWHLGDVGPAYLPNARGFDYHYGLYSGWVDYYTHRTRREKILDWQRNGKPVEEKGYVTDLLAQDAIRLIKSHNKQVPLFLQVAFTAPHAPLTSELVPKEYQHLYSHVTDQTRMLRLGAISALDSAVGKIMAALKSNGMLKNTLVIFFSDNGGYTKRGARNAPFRGGKKNFYEGGVRVPAVFSWEGKLGRYQIINTPLQVVDLYPTLVSLSGGKRKQALPLDGLDIWPTLTSANIPTRNYFLYGISSDLGAIRTGDWKLVYNFRKKRSELFNLGSDPYETLNITAEYPERTNKLLETLNKYAAEQVAPLG